MVDDIALAELRSRVALLEEEAKGEKAITRHILRKVMETEALLLDIRKEQMDMRKEQSDIRSDLALLRADLPGIIANVVGGLLREKR